MRTSPAVEAVMAGKQCSTPGGALETSTFADQLSPPFGDDEK
jgi:hypothetical protein